MEKKLIVEFNFGRKIEINAEELAHLIAERHSDDDYSDTVYDLLHDEMKLFSAVWGLPWVEVYPHVLNECGDPPRAVCLCNEWKKGNAKISVNWKSGH